MVKSVQFWIFFFVSWIYVLGSPALAAGHDPSIEQFFGDYVGQTISGEGGLQARDISVSIQPLKKGFFVKWTTITHRSDGSKKRKAYEIEFRPSGRESIFASAMKKNKFGSRVPLDPLKGEPYVWAKITGKTLTVYALLITHEGGYEMQVYDRTLTDKGMKLSFSRIRNGKILKAIKGTLLRFGG